MTYSEPPVCASGQPIIEETLCPPTLVPPVPQNLPINIVMSGTTYSGNLSTDIPQRINRISALVVNLWKRVNFINFSFSTSFTHTFKMPRFNRTNPGAETITVAGSAFDFQRKMLVVLDEKLDNLYEEVKEIKTVAAVREGWELRPEAQRPTAVFIFGILKAGEDVIKDSKYEISVPWFDPAKMLEFDNTFGYWKGSWQVTYTLNDNSKIIFYTRSQNDVEPTLSRWLSCIPTERKSRGFDKQGPIKGLGFAIALMRLRYIEFFPEGVNAGNPTNYVRFPRRPAELG